MVEFQPIFRNITLLLSLTLIYSLFIPSLRRYPRYINAAIVGVLFGVFSIFTMNDPIRMSNGGIIDARHVIVMVAAIISGWRGGFIAMVISSSYRFYLGNPGMLPGVASIITAFVIGGIYYHYMRGSLQFNRSTLVVGLIIPFSPLVWLTTMSDGVGWQALPHVAPSVLILYPIGTYILLWLLGTVHQRMDLLNTVWQFEQRQDAMFQQTPTMLIGIRPDGMIVNANEAIKNFFGLPDSELIGKDLKAVEWGVLPLGMRQQVEDLFQQALKGEAVRKILEFNSSDMPVSVDTWFLPIRDINDQVVLVFIQGNDISKELQIKEKEYKLHFANERNDILKQLIGDVAHHLKTPLTVIHASSYLLKRHLSNIDIPEEINTKLNSNFTKITNAGQVLNELITDLLNLMNLDTLQAKSFERHNLSCLIQTVIDKFYSVALERDLQLLVSVPTEEINIFLSTSSFQRLIENLVENALRYTESGGIIKVNLHQDGQDAILSVTDTGIGIPTDEIPHIFDRFYRAKNATRKTTKGTGLGLAIVQKIVETHNGRIDVQSQIGVGTTFTVHFPLALDK